MNDPLNSDRDVLADRLVDLALAEAIGGQAPPDLSDRIAARWAEEAASQPLSTRKDAMDTHPNARWPRYAAWGLAATLLVAVGVSLMLPDVRGPREAARRSPTVENQKAGQEFSNRTKTQTDSDTPAREDGLPTLDELLGLEKPVEGSRPASGEAIAGDAPVVYPDPAMREDLTRRRRKYSSMDPQRRAETLVSGDKSVVPLAGDATVALPYRHGSFDAGSGEESSMGVTPGKSPMLNDTNAAGSKSPSQRVQAEQEPRFNSLAISPSEVVPVPPTAGRRIYRFDSRKEYFDRYGVPPSDGAVFGIDAIFTYGDEDTKVRLGVTPRIIIQEEEEKRLGITEGEGPDASGDKYDRIFENPFIEAVGERAVSTFSIDVDTASYANVRQMLLEGGRLPPPDAVRLEEFINYFGYGYAGPEVNSGAAPSPQGGRGDSDAPFAAHIEVAGCTWAPEHRLVRIGVKGREMTAEKRPLSNLVFLIDVSGSMQDSNKLPLVVEGLKALTRELGENDRVAIVVYASSEGLALDSTPGDQQDKILSALGQLAAGGSTAGGAGIELAYKIAEDNKISGGCNRVILCTDGDFNVGTTSTAALQRMVEEKAKQTGVFLSVCGFGRGNLNDVMMETVSNKGNGSYYYIDGMREARRVFVDGLTGTLVTIAKDVKIQVEFNPAQVAGYRLLGYENRMLRTEDFNDDTKDAGEIGAGHTVTALYEIVPAGASVPAGKVDDLKYQPEKPEAAADAGNKPSDELLTLKMRYKQPEGDASSKLEWPVKDDGKSFAEATKDTQFAAAVASFGMLLRASQYAGDATFDAVLEIAGSATGEDSKGERAEFLDMVRAAKGIKAK